MREERPGSDIPMKCGGISPKNSSEQIDYDGYDDFYKVKSKEYRFSNSAKNSDSEFGEL